MVLAANSAQCFRKRCFIILVFAIVLYICITAIVYHQRVCSPYRHQLNVDTSVINTATAPDVHENRQRLPDARNISIPLQFFNNSVRQQTVSKPLIKYEKCTAIPEAPEGMRWPEEDYLDDQDASSLLDIADPITSRVWLIGRGYVKVGDTVNISIQLYNGRNEPRTQGGDLIRVWLTEDMLGAKSTGRVIDNKNGSYTAIVTALWQGKPKVQVAIISPREVIAIAFKRRYICPPVLMNTAIFRHPFEGSVFEETPCSYDNFIPGYSEVCNLTQENYGRPWYCGKPRHKRLSCQVWSMASSISLWNEGYDRQILSPLAIRLLHPKYTARKIPNNIKLVVSKDDSGQSMIMPNSECSQMRRSLTWEYASPTGYFYNKKWINKHCRSHLPRERLISCLENTEVILIGDSTTRQMFEKIRELITPCEWTSDKIITLGRHHPGSCVNTNMNFSLHWKAHSLPFCTRNSFRAYFKSTIAYLNEIHGPKRFVIVIHLFSHFLMYHSHVFYETLQDLKEVIGKFLERNPNAFIVLKGPHAYSFSNSLDNMMWKPDAYAEVYQTFIHNEFHDLRDKVFYLECMDMTVCTEQSFVHPEDYIVNALVEHVFKFTCS